MMRARFSWLLLTVALLLVVAGGNTSRYAVTAPHPTPHIHGRPHSGVAPVQSRPSKTASRPLRGTSAWRLTNPSMAHEIEGYAKVLGAGASGRLQLMVSTSARRFRAYAYRIGGYRGGDGREVWSSRWVRGHQQRPPEVIGTPQALVARWSSSLSVSTRGWSPGFYLVKLVAASGYEAHIPVTLPSPSTRGRVTLVAPTMTWQAYNSWDGYNLYGGATGARRAHAVSFDRPYEAPGAGQFLYNVLGTVVLGERLGVPLAYVSDVDVATRPRLLEGATGYVSLGHDEYWTVPERRHVTKARDSGTNLAFLSSNSVYWRVRLEASESGPNRVVVGYRHDASTSDPDRLSNPAQTTSRWRDWPHPEPENSLTGTFYECFPVDEPYRVATPHWWGFRGTGVHAGIEFPHLVAEEADRVYPVPSTPRPLQILSNLDYRCLGVPTSTQSTYYTTSSGAGVIDFGTQRWSCATQPVCGPLTRETTIFVRKVTSNVLRAFARGPVGRRHPAHDNVAHFPLSTYHQTPTS